MTDIPPRLRAALEGGYELERKLGAGRMATVCLAPNGTHDHRVAVKVLKPRERPPRRLQEVLMMAPRLVGLPLGS